MSNQLNTNSNCRTKYLDGTFPVRCPRCRNSYLVDEWLRLRCIGFYHETKSHDYCLEHRQCPCEDTISAEIICNRAARTVSLDVS